MNKLTRKDFLKVSGMGLGAFGLMMLTGCGSSSSSAVETNASSEDTTAEASDGGLVSQNDENVTNLENVENSYVADVIKIQTSGASSTDPFDNKTSGKNHIYSIYEMLFQVEGFSGEMKAVLADSDKGEFGGYDHEEGSADYTVYIYDYIYDSAGNHITADDVAFSFETTYASGTTSGWSNYDSVEVVDETTMIFHFKNELTGLGELEGIWCRCNIVSEQAYNDSSSQFATDACGTGRYELTEYVTGSKVVIEKRDDYWQTDESRISQWQQANVQTIEYDVISEASQYIIALQSGDLDIVENVNIMYTSDFIDGGQYDEDFNVYSYKSNAVFLALPNCSQDSILHDVNMRLAVFYAIDNAGMCAALGSGAADPAYALGSPVFSDYNAEWDSWENYETVSDAALSKEYQEKAGYNGETLVITCSSSNSTKAEVVQGMLLNAGIDAEIKSYDTATFTAIKEETDSWDIALQQTAASDYLANLWSHAVDTSNTSTGLTENFIDDAEWQEMLDACKSTLTHNEETMNAWWNHALENAYIYGIYVDYKNTVYRNNVETLVYTDKNYLQPGACIYKED